MHAIAVLVGAILSAKALWPQRGRDLWICGATQLPEWFHRIATVPACNPLMVNSRAQRCPIASNMHVLQCVNLSFAMRMQKAQTQCGSISAQHAQPAAATWDARECHFEDKARAGAELFDHARVV